jgi:hypothetical protein
MVTIYRVKVFIWEEFFATKALAATALGFTVAQVDAAVAANVAAGRPAFPVATKIAVGFTGRLADFVPGGTEAEVVLSQVQVHDV